MAKVLSSRLSNYARLACVLAVIAVLLGFGMAGAQDQPKTKVVKPPADPPKKTEEPKKTEPPKTTSSAVPTAPNFDVVQSGKGFGTLDEPTKLINYYIATAWKENNLQPAKRCDDWTFARRVYLDLVGRVPTVAELDAYMKDAEATRREKLLDRLLYDNSDPKTPNKGNPEFATNFATIWNHWLMTRTGPQLYRRQMHLWLEDFFSSPTQSYKIMVEQILTANGRTNENGAVNYILAHLGAANPAGRQAQEGAFDVVPLTARTVRMFLGYQIQCTQCHDHPFNADWKQPNFWGVNVFFRQVERFGNPQMQNNNQMQNVILELKDNKGFNTSGRIFFEKRNGVFLPSDAVFLDKRRIPKDSQLGRREELARFVTTHKNFNPAIVNRLWGHLFGRGLNVKQGYDDFGEHNEVVHPELLAKLGEAFAGSGGHDMRKLIKWICSSDPYNLEAIANASTLPPEAEPYFARMPLKMMSPEQLLESLITATKPPEGNAEGRDAQRNLRNQWMAVLVRNFGDDEGNEVNYNGTILQALLMMNGRDINNAINNSGTAREAQKLVANPKAFVDHLFKASLSRPSKPAEFNTLLTRLRQGPAGDAAMQDLFWALLNCNEFILNH